MPQRLPKIKLLIFPLHLFHAEAAFTGLVDGVTGTDDENLIKMLRDMLRYGASAQIKFNY